MPLTVRVYQPRNRTLDIGRLFCGIFHARGAPNILRPQNAALFQCPLYHNDGPYFVSLKVSLRFSAIQKNTPSKSLRFT